MYIYTKSFRYTNEQVEELRKIYDTSTKKCVTCGKDMSFEDYLDAETLSDSVDKYECDECYAKYAETYMNDGYIGEEA